MREIKFRARRKLNGDWVYGYYVKAVSEDWCLIFNEIDDPIEESDNCRVITSTVGQFTGLKDKNGKDIYEGDICWTYEVGIGNTNRKVIFDSGSFCLSHQYMISDEIRGWKTDYIEVIGNIYENPELL